MSNEVQAIDPGTVDWAAVKRGEIEAPQRIVMPAKDTVCNFPWHDGVAWINAAAGSLHYVTDGVGFGSDALSPVVAEYTNDGHLLRVNVDKPATVPWEDVKDWTNPPGAIQVPTRSHWTTNNDSWWLYADERGLAGFDTIDAKADDYDIIEHAKSFGYVACFERVRGTDTFRLVWKRGQERCDSQYGAAHCHSAAGHVGACDLTTPCGNPRCESFSCAEHDPPEPMIGRICSACSKHGVIRSVTGADGQFCHRDRAGVFLELCPGPVPEQAPKQCECCNGSMLRCLCITGHFGPCQFVPDPAVTDPYPPKCLKCDNRLGDDGQCLPCLEPDWHLAWRKPVDPTFATELPRGATWERWGL